MEYHLIHAFRDQRAAHPKGTARWLLENARRVIWNQVWGGKGPQGGYASPWAAPYWRSSGFKRDPGASLFVDPGKLESHGLRFVDYSDQLLDRLRHTGWFADAFREYSTYRGCVLQLPGHKGKARFIAAYEESESGGYVLDLSRGAVFEEDSRAHGYHCGTRDYDAPRDAARAADSFAQREAEEAREYDTAWQAGAQWAQRLEDERETRKEALKLASEARALRRKVSPDEAPTVCAQIRSAFRELAESITKSRGEREELARGEFARRDWALYFYPDEKLKGAFCEGAGLSAYPA